MPITQSEVVPLQTEQDVVIARQQVRKIAQDLGFNIVDQTKIVTAASELARNAVTHGKGGIMRSEVVTDGSRRGLRLHFEDEGPGISDLDQAMKDGWSSGHGLGLGLSGAKRLMNEFSIESSVGRGTRVTIARWK